MGWRALLCAAATGGLVTFDAANVDAPRYLGRAGPGSSAPAYHVADPTAPVMTGAGDTPGVRSGLASGVDYIAVADGPAGLVILPAQPARSWLPVLARSLAGESSATR